MNKNECLGCRTKGIAECIDTLEKALDKACEELSRLNNNLDRRVITTSTYWKEYLLKEAQEAEIITECNDKLLEHIRKLKELQENE